MYFQQLPIIPSILIALDTECLWVREIYRRHSFNVDFNEVDVFRRDFRFQSHQKVNNVISYYRALYSNGWGNIGDPLSELKVPTMAIWVNIFISYHDEVIHFFYLVIIS